MPIDHENVKDELQTLLDALDAVKATVRLANKDLFNRWKEGGFVIDADLAGEGVIAVEAVIDELLESEPDIDDEDEDEDIEEEEEEDLDEEDDDEDREEDYDDE